MSTLWVLYDSTCPFCAWCRDWLAARAGLVPMRFLCCRSPAARDRFGALPLADQLVVVDDRGRWWAGPEAFAMCLWALDGWRGLADWITGDLVWWLGRSLFAGIAANRAFLGTLVGVDCREGACEVPVGPGAYR